MAGGAEMSADLAIVGGRDVEIVPDHGVDIAPDHSMMVTHLRHLFGDLIGTEWGDGLIEIGWTTASDIPGVTSYRKHKLNKARLFPCTEEGFQSAATEGVLRSGRGSNVYVGIALRKPDTAPFARTSDDDAYCYTAIVFDLDDPGRAENAKNVWKDMPPTLVVMTGMHPYARMQGW